MKKLIVACNAGMGSSVMLDSTLRKQLAKSGIAVEHPPVATIPRDADVVATQTGLADRVRGDLPGIPVVPVQLFPGVPKIARLVKAIENGETVEL
ncbi:PTS system, mannitol-specific IIB component [Salinibacterium xinjiangense]|uniref:PTS system, mannitol-specific IIB component n=1 Tax=Salinibacterium xinjiangense TaxID=386302 RepID=A0A2C9A2X2_9MICO|nr:hypothetical protein [Salinibacterium xinjiangense]SOE73722.1 PTS system, mannitol-specific IIB component [Salinibacterium xinjiangense]